MVGLYHVFPVTEEEGRSMKKYSSKSLCLIAAGCLVLCFLISVSLDLLRRTSADSAPLWVSLLARAILFLLPAVVLALLALFLPHQPKNQ